MKSIHFKTFNSIFNAIPKNVYSFWIPMNTYLVTATFKNVALMGAAYDLFLKVIEEGTLNDIS